MAVRAGINQAVCVLTALVLWLLRVDASFWVGLVFSLLVVFVALAFSQTHIAPDRAPCPYNYECLVNINGTLVKEQ